jgi:hypothetical protein
MSNEVLFTPMNPAANAQISKDRSLRDRRIGR